jgi:hypothetical protein
MKASCPLFKKGRDSIGGKDKPTAKERYDKEKTKMYAIKVVKTTEGDIIEKLDSVPNKSGYIKSLIRKDIKNEK